MYMDFIYLIHGCKILEMINNRFIFGYTHPQIQRIQINEKIDLGNVKCEPFFSYMFSESMNTSGLLAGIV